MDDKFWILAQLPVSIGGLGLHRSDQTSIAGYIASSVACLYDMNSISPDIINCNLPSITSLKEAVNILQRYKQQLTLQNIIEDYSSSTKTSDHSSGFQHSLSEYFSTHNQSLIPEQFKSPREIAWITSLQDPVAGLWLNCSPKTPTHTFSNQEFSTCLTLRLFLPQKKIPPRLKCNCQSQPTLDQEGMHVLVGCNKEGHKTLMHDVVNAQIEKILNVCGVKTTTKVYGTLRGDDPNNNKTIDLLAINLPHHDSGVVFDTRLTSPVPPTRQLSMSEAIRPLRSANISFAQKNNKYSSLALSNNLGFFPMVFELSGRLHPASEKIFRDVLEQNAKEKCAPFSNMWVFYMSGLMATLQRQMATTLTSRLGSIYSMGRQLIVDSNDRINDFAYIN
jgi:hypothetical protein